MVARSLAGMGDERVTGQDYLTGVQYGDDRNLVARQSIYAFQSPVMDLWGRAFELAGIRGDETVLDVGCGNGRYLAAFRARGHRGAALGFDLSAGMISAAREHAREAALGVADAQGLPVRSGSVDVALAMHMLFHVPDRGAAVAELRRVLRPDGVALIATNSETHMQELGALLAQSATAVKGTAHELLGAVFVTYTLENGRAALEASFPSVERHDLVSELVITEVEPIVAYAASLRAFVTDDDDELASVLDEMRSRAAAHITRDGAFRVRTASGIFVCRP